MVAISASRRRSSSEAYLRGIEILPSPVGRFEAYASEAYLRGIEIFQRQAHPASVPRLKPTYEGLKLSFLSDIERGQRKSEAYLRGIEMRHRRRPAHRGDLV